MLIASLGVLLAVVAGISYWRTRGEFGRWTRVGLGALRIVAIGVVTFVLARPVLVIAESIPQRNVVAVLVDDSRSMRVPDNNGQARARAVNALVGARDSALLKALAERYQVRVYRTSAPGRVAGADAVGYSGTRTRLASALLRAQDELAGTPIAGLVILSDGADNSATIPGEPPVADQLLSLRAKGVPVFSVGVGSPRFDREVEISRVEAPQEVLKNATMLLNVVITQRGFGGVTLPVVVEDSGRIVGSASVVMPRNGEAAQVRVRVPATEVGARLLRVRVPLQSGEMVTENNERRAVVVVRDRRDKVLYIEGEPRWEIKFLRRAVEGDGNIQLVTLLRSAKDKFLRLGVEDSLDLATGFPKTRDELFAYRGIVVGSIEASFFSADQLRMLSDFAAERGGGLMFLGGHRAFGEGGYGGTVLSEALPIEFSARVVDTIATPLSPHPTILGALHPAIQIANSDSLSLVRWDSLPAVTTVNAWLRAKPGATVLLEGRPAQGPARPLLAYQRFGRGRVVAFAAQDSWTWQMGATIAVADSTHEVFWRQMLRWLVSGVPGRAEAIVAQESAIGDAVPVRALVSDSSFVRFNGATVSGTVISPTGEATPLTLDWAVDRDGEYASTFVPGQLGVHEVRLTAIVQGDTVQSSSAYVRVAEPTDEYFGAEMRPSLLRQVAEETGGKYYSIDQALDIPKDLRYSPSGSTVVRKSDLWDMPVLFLALLLALGCEWLVRRRKGLA